MLRHSDMFKKITGLTSNFIQVDKLAMKHVGNRISLILFTNKIKQTDNLEIGPQYQIFFQNGIRFLQPSHPQLIWQFPVCVIH